MVLGSWGQATLTNNRGQTTFFLIWSGILGTMIRERLGMGKMIKQFSEKRGLSPILHPTDEIRFHQQSPGPVLLKYSPQVGSIPKIFFRSIPLIKMLCEERRVRQYGLVLAYGRNMKRNRNCQFYNFKDVPPFPDLFGWRNRSNSHMLTKPKFVTISA